MSQQRKRPPLIENTSTEARLHEEINIIRQELSWTYQNRDRDDLDFFVRAASLNQQVTRLLYQYQTLPTARRDHLGEKISQLSKLTPHARFVMGGGVVSAAFLLALDRHGLPWQFSTAQEDAELGIDCHVQIGENSFIGIDFKTGGYRRSADATRGDNKRRHGVKALSGSQLEELQRLRTCNWAVVPLVPSLEGVPRVMTAIEPTSSPSKNITRQPRELMRYTEPAIEYLLSVTADI